MAQGTAVESSVPVSDIEPVELPADLVETDDVADAPDPAIEARARDMGWKPLAEYRGPPGKWQPAADFIKRGEEILPIVRDQNRRLTEDVMKLKGEVTGLRTTVSELRSSAAEQLQIIKDLRAMGQRADQRGYDRAMAEIKAKQRQAVELGDTKAYDQLVEQAEALAESRTVAPAATTTEPTPPAPTRAPALSEPTRQFITANPWFNTDKLLSDTMIAFHQEVLNERGTNQAVLNADPALDRELLEEAKTRVMERYPERFGTAPPVPRPPAQPRRRVASVTPPTSEPPAPRSNGAALTINSIADPAERADARAAYERMKRNIPDYSEAEYMAVYADPHNDILTMQQKPRSQPNGR